MSVGLGLLHRILTDQDSDAFLDDRICSDLFQDDSERHLYEVINEYWQEYERLPSVATAQVESGVRFPEFPDEPLDYWLNESVSRYQEMRIAAQARSVLDSLKHGDFEMVQAAIADLSESAEALPGRGGNLRLLRDDAREALRNHDTRQSLAGLQGVPTGFASVDVMSDGIQIGDVVSLIGRPGQGKTYILTHMARAAYNAGYKVLFSTYEMHSVPVARRIIAGMAHANATEFRLGRLSTWKRRSVLDQIRGLEDRFIILQGDMDATVEGLINAIYRARPDIVYVDGAYILSTTDSVSSKTERISRVIEKIKAAALSMGLRFVCSYQFNREGAKRGGGKLEDIYMSDAIAQVSSLVLGITNADSDGPERIQSKGHRNINLLKGREGEMGKATISIDFTRTEIAEVSANVDLSQFKEPEINPEAENYEG